MMQICNWALDSHKILTFYNLLCCQANWCIFIENPRFYWKTFTDKKRANSWRGKRLSQETADFIKGKTSTLQKGQILYKENVYPFIFFTKFINELSIQQNCRKIWQWFWNKFLICQFNYLYFLFLFNCFDFINQIQFLSINIYF